MSTPDRDSNWAKHVDRLTSPDTPKGAMNLNVGGRRLSGPVQGFGKMWQKTYRIDLGAAAEPARVISTWKERFPEFWPKGNRFFGPLTGIAPGEVALINLTVGHMPLSTGILVIYADEQSFSFMTPEGHIFGGMITFSASADDPGRTVVQVQALIRANDPLYELGLIFGGHRQEDRFWERTLGSLAAHFGVDTTASSTRVCVDRRRQWSRIGNVRHNAAIRSVLYTLGAPVRLLRRR